MHLAAALAESGQIHDAQAVVEKALQVQLPPRTLCRHA
jgi:hypothetical protein